MTIKELCEQYRLEAEAISKRIEKLLSDGEKKTADALARIAMLQTMRRENMETYRHLLSYVKRVEFRKGVKENEKNKLI